MRASVVVLRRSTDGQLLAQARREETSRDDGAPFLMSIFITADPFF
jgi:hypothetical protein